MMPIKYSSENKIDKTQYKTTRQDDVVESEVKQLRTQKLIMGGVASQKYDYFKQPWSWTEHFYKITFIK